ncbi:MAG: hypothetical protein ACK56I_22055, partial [bacterium]
MVDELGVRRASRVHLAAERRLVGGHGPQPDREADGPRGHQHPHRAPERREIHRVGLGAHERRTAFRARGAPTVVPARRAAALGPAPLRHPVLGERLRQVEARAHRQDREHRDRRGRADHHEVH